jgi:putative hydrolase
MSTPPPEDEPRAEGPWDALLRAMLGPDADAVLRDLSERGGLPDLSSIGFVGSDGAPLDLEALAAAAGVADNPEALGQVLGQIKRVLDSSGEDPVNWELAHDLARQVAVAEGDPSVSQRNKREVTAAFSAAEAWLDAATDIPSAGGPVRTWCRSDWVEHTMARWRTLAEPVATSVADALVAALRTQAPDAVDAFNAQGAEIGGQMMRQLGGAVFGMQVGQAAGTLAREVFGSTDIGLPLIEGHGVALVPRNVADFAKGLDVPVEEVRLFLALREAAHARLFTHVTWLRAHLLGTVEAYARGITIDMSSLEEAVRSIDPTDPEALRDALSEGVFSLDTTPEQEAALLRLETALALVEGWVDEVTAAAARPHLPHTAALREMMRRRRAAGGPAEDTFATLVGLELRPRRSRDAANLWSLITQDGGTSAREAVWDHPDLLPGPEDLDNPAGYSARLEAEVAEHDDVDQALAAIFGAHAAEVEAEAAGATADDPDVEGENATPEADAETEAEADPEPVDEPEPDASADEAESDPEPADDAEPGPEADQPGSEDDAPESPDPDADKD